MQMFVWAKTNYVPVEKAICIVDRNDLSQGVFHI